MPFVQLRVLPFEHSYDAIGLSGLCWMSALVSALAYGFVLELVPDVREASDGYPTMKTDTSVTTYVFLFCSFVTTGVAGGHRDAVRGHCAVQEVQLEGRGREERRRGVGHLNQQTLTIKTT